MPTPDVLIVGYALGLFAGFFFGLLLATWESSRDQETRYRLRDLKAGGHCGCCGKWLPDAVVPQVWPWTVCDQCIKEADHADADAE